MSTKMFLFVICIKVLSNYINNDNEIKGIKINDLEIKQILFADDATFLNDGTQEAFEKLIEILKSFENGSGLKLNTKKKQLSGEAAL